MTLDDRNKWIKQRFGEIDPSILGDIDATREIIWPSLEESFRVRDNLLTYRMIKNIEIHAHRIAEIYRNGAYEMIHNSDLEWHHDPDEIVAKVNTKDWNFYGCWIGETLIAVESLYILRGDLIMEWVWGCVDPIYRGKGVWQHIGIYTDKVAEESGAQLGSVWVVTTHKYSQMAVEKAGYVPMGCFIGKRFYGGADNRYYRHTLIHYAKLYHEAEKHLQNWNSMQLTPEAAQLVSCVRNLWNEDS